jgi:hypothetical protein
MHTNILSQRARPGWVVLRKASHRVGKAVWKAPFKKCSNRGSLLISLGKQMGNKIVTEADRKASPRPATLPGFTLPTGGRGQKISLERGVATRSKKNPGKRANKGG